MTCALKQSGRQTTWRPLCLQQVARSRFKGYWCDVSRGIGRYFKALMRGYQSICSTANAQRVGLQQCFYFCVDCLFVCFSTFQAERTFVSRFSEKYQVQISIVLDGFRPCSERFRACSDFFFRDSRLFSRGVERPELKNDCIFGFSQNENKITSLQCHRDQTQ